MIYFYVKFDIVSSKSIIIKKLIHLPILCVLKIFWFQEYIFFKQKKKFFRWCSISVFRFFLFALWWYYFSYQQPIFYFDFELILHNYVLMKKLKPAVTSINFWFNIVTMVQKKRDFITTNGKFGSYCKL